MIFISSLYLPLGVYVLNESKITIFRNLTGPSQSQIPTSQVLLFNLQRTLHTKRPRGQSAHAKRAIPEFAPRGQFTLQTKIITGGTCGERKAYKLWVRESERLAVKLKGATRAFPPEWLFTNDRSCLVIRELMHHHRIWIDGRADWPFQQREKDEKYERERALSVRIFWPSAFYCAVPVYFAINAQASWVPRPLFFWFIFKLHAPVPSHQ